MRQSARLLGISRTALYNKLNQWQVDLIALRKNMRSPV
jgi:DNA-binding NtrC family response regulator